MSQVTRKKSNPYKLIIVSGPSCVGKSPLYRALKKFYPQMIQNFIPVVAYHDRSPRPGEQEGVDYYFRSRTFIEALRKKKDFVVMEVRRDLVALDLKELIGNLKRGHVFYEGNAYVATSLLTHPSLKQIPTLSVFLSPLSKEEIQFFKTQKERFSLEALITEIMRRKLLKRTQRQKGCLSLKDLKTIEVRAQSAFVEIQKAYQFEHVIVNHDGEDSEHWDAFYYPIGDARKTLLTFIDLLQKGKGASAETWEKDLL